MITEQYMLENDIIIDFVEVIWAGIKLSTIRLFDKGWRDKVANAAAGILNNLLRIMITH